MTKQEFEKYLRAKGMTNHSFIPTGFKALDDLVDGFYPGTVWIIGGWPGTGKTTTLMNLVANLKHTKILLFDTETTKQIWMEKFISLLAMIPYKDIRTDIKNTLPSLLLKLNLLDDYDIIVVDDSSPTLQRIEQSILKHTPKVVAIDYIQNIDAEEQRFANRYSAYTYVVRQLERLAKNYNTTVILCSQLRKPDREQDRPTLFDLKETGKLGEAAHVVMLLRKHEDGLAVDIAKSRNGLLGEFVFKGMWGFNKLT